MPKTFDIGISHSGEDRSSDEGGVQGLGRVMSRDVLEAR